jgi:hypothetical protein
MIRVALLPLALLFGIVMAGCTPPTPVATSSGGPPAPPPPPGPPVPVVAAQPATEIVKAEAGVGKQGQSLDEYEGVVVTPVKSLFAAKQRAFFEIEFPHNYNIWKQSNDVPKDYDDLKARFLDPLGLTAKMPELPAGQRYVWDAEKEELQVERPKKKGE